MKYLTYTHSRQFGGYKIPISIQSGYIRSYCLANNISFVIPKTEYCLSNCYGSLINMINKYSCEQDLTIIMTSVYMLQESKKINEEAIGILKRSNIKYSCILEGINCSYEDVMIKLQEFYEYNNIALSSPV